MRKILLIGALMAGFIAPASAQMSESTYNMGLALSHADGSCGEMVAAVAGDSQDAKAGFSVALAASWIDHSVGRKPTSAEFADVLNFCQRVPTRSIYDMTTAVIFKSEH